MTDEATRAGPRSPEEEIPRMRGVRPQIPDHELLRCIGSGSYGEVWLARNVMGTYRAVKLVYRATFDDDRPYEREFSGIKNYEPISRTHDDLVDILQVGHNDAAGCFYYVMEVCDDVTLGQKIDPGTYEPRTLGQEIARRGRLPFEECLRLALALAEGLGHLHKHGLIHRDIKPSNIIFVNGIPKIADIGLVATVGTSRSFVGTEGFIPPEGPGTIQADIYSLGKVLYEISSGKDRQTFPALPTALGEETGQASYLELNEVVLRACESDPRKRYKSTEAMQADLLLLQAGKSVKRLRLLERRLAVVARIALIAAALMIIFLVAYYQTHRERTLARRNLALSYATYGTRLMDAGDLFGALPWFAEALRLEDMNLERAQRYRLQLGVASRASPKLVRLWTETGLINDVQFSHDARRVVIAGVHGNAAVYDVRQDALAFRLMGHDPNREVESAGFSPDDRLIVTSGADGTARIWEAATGRLVRPLPHGSNSVLCARFDPTGSTLVTACRDGIVRLWPVSGGEPREFRAHAPEWGVKYASFSPDGQRIVTCSYDETARMWDVKTLGQVGTNLAHGNWVYQACYSPDNRYLVTASYDPRVCVWSAATGERLFLLDSDAPVRTVGFSPDGRYVIAACWDYGFNVRIWDLETRKEAFPPFKLSGYPTCAAFSPDGHQVLAASANGLIRQWDLVIPASSPASQPGFYSPEGSLFVTLQANTVRVWSALSGDLISSNIAPRPTVRDVRFTRDGKRLLTLSTDARAPDEGAPWLQLWDGLTGKPLSSGFRCDAVRTVSLSKDGRRMATLTANGAEVWDVSGGTPLPSPRGPTRGVSGVVLSPDASRLVTFLATNAVLWDAATGERLATLTHISKVAHAEFSPTGHYLVTCCSEGALNPRYAQLWDSRTGRAVRAPLWHSDGVKYASFSPDGEWVVTASEDRTAVIWDTKSGRQRAQPLVHKHQVMMACFSPDGRWIATVDWHDQVRVWDATTGAPLTPSWTPRFRDVLHVQFAAAGTQVLATGAPGDGWMIWESATNAVPAPWQMWSVAPDERPVDEIILLGELLSGHRLGLDGQPTLIDAAALATTWQRLRSRYPDDFKVSRQDVLAWHQENATVNEQAGNWFAARFHLDQLLKIQPEEAPLKERRQRALERLDSQH